jgi:signal transduction histidine kinase
VIDTVRQLWAEPRVPQAPARVWRDWVLTVGLLIAAVLEVALRTDLGWPAVAFVLGVACAVAMLYRRTHPLAAVAVAFTAHALGDSVMFFGAHNSAMLFSSAALLVLPYSLLRWASGAECVIGMAVMVGAHAPHGPNAVSNWGEAAGLALFLLLPAALGAAIRYRATARFRETDQVKLREREQLARELHDTIAHHVSAIVIQAQAGRTVVAGNPAAAARALEAIESEASRALAEMRFMVNALRAGEDPDLTPQRGIADIPRLARHVGSSPMVAVRVGDGLDDLRPSIGAALYRLAQESITNAIRHARHATRVDVDVAGDSDSIRLTVRDDGDPAAFNATTSAGYGLIGMKERAMLLGGTLEAGPVAGRGWAITAVLPRHGVAP